MSTRLPDSEELTIKTGGQTIGGWEHFSVTRGIELCPSICEINLTERAPTQVGKAIVTPFSPCEAFLSEDKILTGFIDIYQPNYDADNHAVSIACRSKTEDVVDCSVDVEQLKAWSIAAGSVQRAAQMLCDPYGITVKVPDGDEELDPRYPIAIQPGMTCYQLIEEMCRQTRMLVWDDSDGNLILTKGSAVGSKRAGSALVEGKNILTGAARHSGDQRFQKVKVVSQYWYDDTSGPHNAYEYTATDNQVPRPRMIILPIQIVSPDRKWVQQRAEWEVSRRYGRSRAVRVVVVGWRDGNDKLWQPNTMVNVQAPELKISEDMVISQCTWQRDETGTKTIMVLAPPSAFQPPPFNANPLLLMDPGTSTQRPGNLNT